MYDIYIYDVRVGNILPAMRSFASWLWSKTASFGFHLTKITSKMRKLKKINSIDMILTRFGIHYTR